MEKVVDKFVRYVKIETTSIEEEEVKQPTNDKEWDLINLLADELKQMKLEVTVSKFGYVYTKIPSNTDKKVPKICFISHVDTSPELTGKNVNPQIWKNYDGKDINIGNGYVLSVEDNPLLSSFKGKTLITTDGSTLLGSDDKAGVSEIMCMTEYLVNHPEVKHGDIMIAFTPDEEIGRGTDNFDVKFFGADYGYTVDGGTLGELEYENFNAASMIVEVFGKTIHPGEAKNKMKNALRIIGEFDNMLPENMRPEHTEGYEGFYHLLELSGTVEKAKASYLIREHDKELFNVKKELAKSVETYLNAKYGKDTVKVTIKDSYPNMAEVIKDHFHLIENAKKAMTNVGVTPVVKPIRGGTDGAKLSFENLPCPNICTGGQNFHSRYEYACLDDMEKVVEILIEIVKIYHDF
ncbi:peptidase T [Anaeromyces robustus]|uniref:Peptidase T n=1 Tax=Anaeromyces robustus TaxID=1754192 RepID=A0A1Y1WA10_9FUNG|nr:peptidase T [Anaeromyces robustus]|eukprot:ORX70379.1 peptidase T [Anaeromyces robustus]